jgi:hypothetical protein
MSHGKRNMHMPCRRLLTSGRETISLGLRAFVDKIGRRCSRFPVNRICDPVLSAVLAVADTPCRKDDQLSDSRLEVEGFC